MNLSSFLRVAVRDMRRVGAVMPSSRYASKAILKRVPNNVRTIVEYGPGDGVLTKALLDRLPADGTLLAIETNPTFIETLDRIGDKRLSVVQGSATKAEEYAAAAGVGSADLVISGIPFSMLSKETRREVVAMSHRLLRPGGVFLVYQTSPLMAGYLKKKFAVTTAIEFRNVPPYFIMAGRKSL